MKFSARILATIAMVSLSPVLALHAQHAGAEQPPKVDLFVGFTHFGTPSNEAATNNRMIGLNGGSASITFRLTRNFGIVADVGGYDDSQVQLTGTGSNLPRTVDSSGTAYTYLFGPQFTFRQDRRVSPFVRGLVGGIHASAVTLSNCIGTPCTVLPDQDSLAMAAGGGIDIRLTRRIALRAIQAEYMITRFPSPTTSASATQNDMRLSTGFVFHFAGDSAPRPSVQLVCSVQPASVFPGDPVSISGTATNLNLRKKAIYTWTSDAGPVTGGGDTASVSALSAGTYTVKGHVSEGPKSSEMADCTAQFTVRAFDPPTISCSANPSTIHPGDSTTITARGISPQGRPLSYSYSADAGSIGGSGSTATLSNTNVVQDRIAVTCNVTDDKGQTTSAQTNVSVIAPPPPPAPMASMPPPAPMATGLCTVNFGRDHARPTRVDNEAKACLDAIALSMQRAPDTKLMLVGNGGPSKTKRVAERTAKDRALHTKAYLVAEKGIDDSRITEYIGTSSDNTVTTTMIPSGATVNTMDAVPIP